MTTGGRLNGKLKEFLQEKMRKFRVFCALLGMSEGWRAGSSDTDSKQSPYSENNYITYSNCLHGTLISAVFPEKFSAYSGDVQHCIKKQNGSRLTIFIPVALVFEKGMIFLLFFFPIQVDRTFFICITLEYLGINSIKDKPN